MLCSELTLVKQTRLAMKAVTLFCNSWSCEICAPRRARKIAGQLKEGKPTKFLTLTVNPDIGADPAHRADMLATAFRKWIRQLRKQHPASEVEYYCVFEKTDAGEPHLHILGRWPFVKQSVIANFMEAEIGAPIVWIEAVKSQNQAAGYLSKYLSKDCTKFGKLKRYFKSRGYIKAKQKEEEPWPWCHLIWEKSERPIMYYFNIAWKRGMRPKFFDSGGGFEACGPES